MLHVKTCCDCELVLPLDAFYAHPYTLDRHAGVCKECAKMRAKRVSKSPERRAGSRQRYLKNKDRRVISSRKWHDKNRERARVAKRGTRAVAMAVRAGRLVRATKCEKCGTTERKIEGAHKSATSPLDVIWLCGYCHRAWDAAQPKTIGASLDESRFTILGVEYRALFDLDPRFDDAPPRWVVYGKRCRYRAVATGEPNVFTLISDRVAGNEKPLRKGVMMGVLLIQKGDKLELLSE